jgi:3-oxocholest-4-en-26-oyl-CoA dehydrogenase alpha subunit
LVRGATRLHYADEEAIMDFRLSDEDVRFRDEVRSFIRQEMPRLGDDLGGEGEREADWQAVWQWGRTLGRKGWLALAWPKEFGGLAASHMEQTIFREEMAYAGAPDWTFRHALGWVGPGLMLYGTGSQQREFLPRIAGGDVMFCTLFSEPNAGSDLASLKTLAIEEGDEFVVNGQKIWTTWAHKAEYGWMSARTDPNAPQHKGISNFIVPMDAPGITIQPIYSILGVHYFNQVYFDNVRLPRTSLVGEKDRGWYQTAVSLDFERSGVGYAAGCRRQLDDFVARLRAEQGLQLDLASSVRTALADLAVAIEVARMLSYRVTFLQSRGQVPNYEASMSKVYGSELTQRLARTLINILGLHGQLRPGSAGARMRGRLERSYLGTVGATIAAGTSEIGRSVIATRGLGLPRG